MQDLMGQYYLRLFPHETVYRWLAYGNDGPHPQADKGYFQRREFNFTLEGDIFVRYLSYKDGAEFAKDLKARRPTKIDIGPVYNLDPRKRQAYKGAFKSAGEERELVFDVDIDDYDDVTNFTYAKDGWDRCWPLMQAVVQVLDHGLREDFGFQHIMWVFSGRRGIHCWVNDRRARLMTDEQRSAVAQYFNVYQGREKGRAKLAFNQPMHPSTARAFAVLEKVWREKILPKQELLTREASRRAVLEYVPDEQVRDKVAAKWARMGAAEGHDAQMWGVLVEEVGRAVASTRLKGNGPAKRALQKCTTEIVFAFAYPRVDIEVSKKKNHLLKAPFCVHPKTGKVCVPFDPAKAHLFNVERDVPTVAGLLNEMERNGGKSWRDTRLKVAVDWMEEHLLKGLRKENQAHLDGLARAAANAPSLAF